MRINLVATFTHVDRWGRCIFSLDDESAELVAAISRALDPSAFPVKCKIPPLEYMGRWLDIVVIPRKYSFTSTAPRTRGQKLEGYSFTLETASPRT